MEKNMSVLATKPEIEFSASIYNAKGEKMMTYHLKARMANTVRFPRSCWGADFHKSEVSKETLGQQISRKKREERDGVDSRNPSSAGPSFEGTVCPEEDPADESSNQHMEDEPSEDEEEMEFWITTRDDNDVLDHKVKPSSMTCDLGL
jgi:hypothetical protein